MSNSGNVPPYSLAQTVFMLSLSSNALFDQNNSQANLQDTLNLFLRGYLPNNSVSLSPFFTAMNKPNVNFPSLAMPSNAAQGDWQAVWGPVVYVADLNQGATNTMYVAYSASLKTYVVAIAGTNPSGWTAATVEDLEVGPDNMVAWPATLDLVDRTLFGKLQWQPAPKPPASQPAIDAGTSSGLDVLYGMVCPYTNQRLVDFLNPQKKGSPTGWQLGQTIVFTGHSLGGALSPSLAMLLYPKAAKPYTPKSNEPNPNGGEWSHVYILATAGPTPGNQGFASLFYSPTTLPPIPTPTPAPQQIPYPPTALSLVGVSGNYMPVATNAGAPSNNTWPLMYWNVNYANTYDVVPRAWTILANLVQAPNTGSNGYFPAFFGGGAMLSGTSNTLGILSVGTFVYDMIGALMAKAGYSGTSTPFYTQCLMHFPIMGNWGNWSKGQLYPQGFMPDVPPKSFQTFDDVVPWILDAHLGQYSKALLGYPCLAIGQQLAPAGNVPPPGSGNS